MDLYPSLTLDLPPLPSNWKKILYENLNFGTLPLKTKVEDVVSLLGESESSEESESSTEYDSDDMDTSEYCELFREMLKKALELKSYRSLMRKDSEDVEDPESVPKDATPILEKSGDLRDEPEFENIVDSILVTLEDVAAEPTDDEMMIENSLVKISAVKTKFESLIREISGQKDSEDVENILEPPNNPEDSEGVHLDDKVLKDSEDVDSVESAMENVLDQLETSDFSKNVLKEDSECDVKDSASEDVEKSESFLEPSELVPEDVKLLEDIQKIQNMNVVDLDNDVKDSEEQNATLDFYADVERVAALADELFDLISSVTSESSQSAHTSSEDPSATMESSEDGPEPSTIVEVVTEASGSSDDVIATSGGSSNIVNCSDIAKMDSEYPEVVESAYGFRLPREIEHYIYTNLKALHPATDDVRKFLTTNILESEEEQDDWLDSIDDSHCSYAGIFAFLFSKDSESPEEPAESLENPEDQPISGEAARPASDAPEDRNKCESSEKALKSTESTPLALKDERDGESSDTVPESPESALAAVSNCESTGEAAEDVPTLSMDPELASESCSSSSYDGTESMVPEEAPNVPTSKRTGEPPEFHRYASESTQNAPNDASHDAPESPSLTIQIPLESNSIPNPDDLLDDHLPVHILHKKSLLAEETRRFLVTSLILQSQQASANASLSLENSEYPDFDDLRVRELPISLADFNVPRRIQWQFIDFYARVHMFKAWNLVIQCQNAAENSKKSIGELAKQRLWENDDVESRECLLMAKTSNFRFPDSIMRLHYDVAQQIDRFKADVFIIQSQLAAQNSRLPLATAPNLKWTMPSLDVSGMLRSLGFASIVPNVIRDQLESIINQCQLYIYRRMVLCDQKASWSATKEFGMNSTLWSEAFSDDEQSEDSSTLASTFTSLQDRLLEDAEDSQRLLNTDYSEQGFSDSEEEWIRLDSGRTLVRGQKPMRRSL